MVSAASWRWIDMSQSLRRIAPLLVVGVVLLSASPALAWGPATHAKLATDVLAQLGMLPAALAAILSRHGSSYIFGNIAADVVFAKRLSRIKQFCHHWSTGFKFLDNASDDCDRAFAYGYLSHLAADTVAHGKYVPRQLSVTRTTHGFGHLYWEMRGDALVDREAWQVLEEVMAADHEHHHRALAQELTATLLPYHFNRRLFDRINRLVIRDYWKRCMDVWHRCSRWDLCSLLVEQYRAESVDRIMDVLTNERQSSVLAEDPNGTAALHQARVHRRVARKMRWRGISTLRHSSEAAAGLAPNVRPRQA